MHTSLSLSIYIYIERERYVYLSIYLSNYLSIYIFLSNAGAGFAGAAGTAEGAWERVSDVVVGGIGETNIKTVDHNTLLQRGLHRQHPRIEELFVTGREKGNGKMGSNHEITSLKHHF